MSVRTERLNLTLSTEEAQQIAENAAWFGMKVTEYTRYAALGNTTERPVKKSALRKRAEMRAGVTA